MENNDAPHNDLYEQLLDERCRREEHDRNAFDLQDFPEQRAVLLARQILVEADQTRLDRVVQPVKQHIGKLLIHGFGKLAPGLVSDFERRFPAAPPRVNNPKLRWGTGKNFLDR